MIEPVNSNVRFKTVVISKRFNSPDPFHICVDGRLELWESGISERDAMARIEATHRIKVGRIIHRGLLDLLRVVSDNRPEISTRK